MMLYFKNDLSFHLIEYEDRVRPLMPFFEAIGGEQMEMGNLIPSCMIIYIVILMVN